MWIVYGLLAAVTAALMTISGKIGLKKVDPTLATGIRSFFMFVFMFGVVLVSGKAKGWQSLAGREYAWIILAAALGAASWLFYFLGLKLTSASKLASLDRLSLPLIILFSILFLSETFSWKLVLGGVIVAIGAMIVAQA
ncbi:EamA family transporter [Candidatus Uhrbacteria bacterium]|nr:EamA family transporter [Candidatus Uhrbacteria bacterium]